MTGRPRACAALLEPGGRILDIGCSSGWLSESALALGFREYVGFDRLLRGVTPSRPRVRYVSGSAFALPFDNASFDAIAIFDVIQEMPRGRELEALEEAHRVLRPGGTLYLSAPHANLLHTPLDPVWYLGRRHYRRPVIKKLLASAGFWVERMTVWGGPVETLDYLVRWLSRHVIHRDAPRFGCVDRLVEREYRGDRRFGMTVFVVARRT